MKTVQAAGLACAILMFTVSCSREINADRLQKRGELYYVVNEEQPYSGKVIEVYDNGQKQSECTYTSGKRQGGWSFWTESGEKCETGTVTDIDGNTYLSIKIGDQWWMAENLNATRYRNGDAIPRATGGASMDLPAGVYCDYGNSAAHAASYGYLYNWNAVNDPRGIAPEGWHVASDAEWQQLVDYLGGISVAGGKMKAARTGLWNEPNAGATNESGFSALPGGYCHDADSLSYMGGLASFWSSSEYAQDYAWYRGLNFSGASVYRYYYDKRTGFSVRCVKDE